MTEVDHFLMSTTDPKLRNQANLLKAESLFKKGRYAEAAKVYQSLVDQDLPENYKRETLFKLGWSLAQTGDSAAAITTFTDYLKKYPASPAAASATLQRGLASMKQTNYAAAMTDFNTLIDSFPKAKERELALQNKALILGQQKNYKDMSATFQKLLADYPKSEAAGQANFWIGWSAFEDKDYKGSVASLEAARKLDPKNYGERSALRVMLAHYNLQDWKALEDDVDSAKGVTIAPEIYKQLGDVSFAAEDYPKAEKYYTALSKTAE